MGITHLTGDEKPGDLYVDDHFEVSRLFSYCLSPTATVEDVATGRKTGGGVGCLNLDPFRKIAECGKDDLIKVLQNLVHQFVSYRENTAKLEAAYIDLQKQLIEANNKIIALNSQADRGC